MSHLPRFADALLALGLVLSACSPAASARLAQSSLQRDTRPSIPAATITQLAASNNVFALDLYRSLRSQAGNLVFSPFSISLALAMPYAGARGETESQMAHVLHFDLPQDSLHAAFNDLDLALTQEGRAAPGGGQPMQLDIANAAWAEQTQSFRPQYLDLLASNYGAGIHLADFVNQPEPARLQINAWVSQQTQNKIQNLIPKGALGTTARLVLINAIYFKADWQDQFDPRDTRPGDFTLLDGSRVQVQMMSNPFLTAPYTAGKGYQAVELPYQGGTAVMDVILPDPGSFDGFEGRLDAPTLEEILAALQPTTVALEFPKYRFGAEFDLGDQLAALGMTDALDANLADFSGMTGGRDLFITKVLHKAQVAVDEKGTEAAAATSVVMAPTMALEPSVTLKVDRPFFFAIRDIASGQILFLGRVLDPTSS